MVLTRMGLRFMGRLYPCSIGKGGRSADKREGDGATPRGTYQIAQMFYRADRMARPASWAVPIGPRDLWSDDMDDARYNTQVRAPYPHSHEQMRRGDPLYDLILTTTWNWPDVVAGKGAAIFLHQWRRPGFPTEGCIAISRAHLHRIAGQVQPGTRIIVP